MPTLDSTSSATNALVFLAQTDTTAGFLSTSKERLNAIKKRPLHQKILLTMSSLSYLHHTGRIPKDHKRLVRRAKATSFVAPNGNAFRIVHSPEHCQFLRYFGALYSTSANPTKQPFDLSWAIAQSDIIVLDSRGIYESAPSKILQLGRKKIKTLRK